MEVEGIVDRVGDSLLDPSMDASRRFDDLDRGLTWLVVLIGDRARDISVVKSRDI